MAGRDPFLTRGVVVGAGRYDGVEPGAKNRPTKAGCCFGEQEEGGSAAADQAPSAPSRPSESTPLMDDYRSGKNSQIDFQSLAQLRAPPRNTLQFHAESMAALVLIPMILYIVNTAFFGFPNRAEWGWTTLSYVVSCVSLAFCGILIQVYLTSRENKWIYLYLGVLGIGAVFMGYTSGNRLYERDMGEHWLQGSRVRYENVTATHMADALPDAGIIGFTNGARIDMRRVLGFRPAGTETTYCVAPILDDTQANDEYRHLWGDVQFWAVGVDCCGSHWGFWCDDAQVPGTAENAVVISGVYSSYAMERYQLFQKAAHNAAAFYHLSTPQTPVFVRWVQQTQIAQHGFTDALLRFFLMSLLYCIVSVLLAGALHWSGPARSLKKPDMLPP